MALQLAPAGLAVALLLAAQEPAKPAVSAADARKLREQYAAALTEPFIRGGKDGAETRKLLDLGKKLAAKHDAASLLAALRAGPLLDAGARKSRKVGGEKEKLEEFGPTIAGFTFEFGKETFRYAVDVPPDYDPAMPCAVVIDPGHGTGAGKDAREKAEFVPYFRGSAKRAGIAPCLVVRTEIIEEIGGDGRRGQRSDEEIGAVFDAFFRDFASRFAVDPERVYAAGISQTGFYSWYLARARPDRFAGIAPLAAVTWQVQRALGNLRHVPVFAANGEKDAACPPEPARDACAALTALGGRARFEMEPGGEHSSVFGRMGPALQWLREQGPRNAWPRSLDHRFVSGRNPWAYWIRVDELEREHEGASSTEPPARVQAEVDGQTIRLTTSEIREITLGLAPELLDLSQPVRVEWNGKTVHEGVVKADFAASLSLAVEKAEWRASFAAVLSLKAPR